MRLSLPGLYNVYNALAAASLAIALDVELDEIVAGLGRFQRRLRTVRARRGGRPQLLLLLIKNPAGANEAIRTLEDGGVPATLVVALNDAIADGRDVSWIWDVDFEPLLERAERIVVSGERAAELALRFTYAGFPRERLEVIPDLEPALDRGLELTDAGRRARGAPDLHRDARAAGDRDPPRLHAAVLGVADGDPRRAPLPRVPQHLRRPRQHRRARASRRGYAVISSWSSRSRSAEPRRGRRTTCSTSAAVRIASRR